MADGTPVCPHCGVPRVPGLECPRCGVIYAKAAAHAAHSVERPAPPEATLEFQQPLPSSAPSSGSWAGETDEARTEFLIRLIAVPLALAGATLAAHAGFLHALLRIGLTMMVHESGHAVTAWFCGYAAIPTLWKTLTPENRSFFAPLLLGGALVFWIYRSWQAEQRNRALAGAGLLALQAFGTLGLRAPAAQALITFGGDGGCLVLGTLLMASMYAPQESSLVRNWLRWGFLVIGAGAFADAFSTWWAAHRDYAELPFGNIEGVGLSDASKLTDVYQWSVHDLIGRYLALGTVCLVVLAVIYAVGLVQARAELQRSKAG